MITAPRTTSPAILLAVMALSACASKGASTSPSLTTGAAPAPTAAPTSTASPTTSTGATPADSATMATVMRASAPGTARSSDRSVLTGEEMRATQYTNLYDVVRTLRGNWLRVRSADSFGKSSTLQVYLDMQRLNGVEELRSMAPTNILSVRYFDPIQASARWGMDHGAGAIFILTKK